MHRPSWVPVRRRSDRIGRVRTDPRRVLLAVALLGVVAVLAAPAEARGIPDGAGTRRPPVAGTIIDRFRPPPTPYAAGNRGLDYRTAPLTVVSAISAGTVVFAGVVAGSRHVTVRHDDGLRSSYSFLAVIDVAVGAVVAAGDRLGLSTEVFHLGLRDPAGTYLDPEPYLAGPASVPHVELVPDAAVATVSAREERLALATVARAGVAGPAAGLVARAPEWTHLAIERGPSVHRERIAAGVRDWFARRAGCPAPRPADLQASCRTLTALLAASVVSERRTQVAAGAAARAAAGPGAAPPSVADR